MKKLSLFVAVFGFAAAMVACGDNNSKGNFEALTAQQWQLDKIVYADSTVDSPKGVTIIFTDSMSLFGRGGCNGYFGKYETEAETNKLTILPVGSTLMFCPNIEFETTYYNLLEEIASYKATDNSLELKDADKNTTLVYSPKPEEVAVREETMEVVGDTTNTVISEAEAIVTE